MHFFFAALFFILFATFPPNMSFDNEKPQSGGTPPQPVPIPLLDNSINEKPVPPLSANITLDTQSVSPNTAQGSGEASTQRRSSTTPFYEYQNDASDQKSIQILELARQYTNNSSYHASMHSVRSSRDKEENLQEGGDSISLDRVSTTFNPFLDASVPALDPHSDDFDPRAWARHILHARLRDPDRYPLLAAGVSFKSLGAYGHSTGSDYQKTVFNTLISYKDIFKFLSKKKDPEITILKEFNGLVRSGECCVVLGRPGA